MTHEYLELAPDEIIDTFYNRIKKCIDNKEQYINLIKNLISINGNKIPEKIKTLIDLLPDNILCESDLVNFGFEQHTMAGTGWNSINSMCDAIYYYENGKITINATEHWTWFLDGIQRNDISVNTKSSLLCLLETHK